MSMKLVTDSGEIITVHVLRGAAARKGYRGRPEPDSHEGLFFPFGRQRLIPDFTMTGVPFDLDLVVLDRPAGHPSFQVIEVIHLAAEVSRVRVGLVGVAALELAAGEARRLGLGTGSLLTFAW